MENMDFQQEVYEVVAAIPRGRLAPCWQQQRPLLEAEGVKFRRNGCVDMKVSQ